MGGIFERARLVGSGGRFDTGASYSCIRQELAERLAHVEPLRFVTANPQCACRSL